MVAPPTAMAVLSPLTRAVRGVLLLGYRPHTEVGIRPPGCSRGCDMAAVHGKNAWRLGGVAAALAGLVAGGITASAWGNPNYEGILSSSDPTGYQASPTAYDISSGPVTITLQESVQNLTSSTEVVPLLLSVHHILTLNGTDISDGQPGQAGITWTTGLWRQSTQALAGKTPVDDVSVPAAGSAPTQLQWSWTFNSCGYYQLDVQGIPAPPVLATAYVRILGCSFGQRLTPGYWKNHETATSALLPLNLGGYTVSTFSQASAIFDAMKCNQPANCLAGHLLAAELDVAGGSAPCIQSTINDANAFLSGIGYNGVASYSLTGAQKNQALSLETALDDYTNDSSSATC